MVYSLTFYPAQLSDLNGVYSTRINALKALVKHAMRVGETWSALRCIHSDEYSFRYTFRCMGVKCYADICAHEIDEI